MANSSIYNRIYGKAKSMKGGAMSLANLLYEKRQLLVLTFANLIAQLAITYYVMMKTNSDISVFPIIIAQFVIIYVLIMIPMPPFVKFLIFCLFSYLFGLIFSSLKKKYNPQMIELAIQSALSVFAVFLALGMALFVGGIRLGLGFGMVLFVALLGLIITRLIIMATGLTQYNKMISIVGIILFALYVLYDTNIIIQRNYYGDFITASLDYYLDIINLFTNFLGYNSD